MDMKFSIGERVKICGKDIIGEVVQMEYKYFYDVTGEVKITKRYLVQQIGGWHKNWYEEDMLESILELSDELSDIYASKVYDVLIDVALMTRDFEMAKMLVEEKKKHLK
jgi:hypothetical protein